MNTEKRTHVEFNALVSLVEQAVIVADLLDVPRTQLVIKRLREELGDLASDVSSGRRITSYQATWCPIDLTPIFDVIYDMSDQTRPENPEIATIRDEYPSGLRVLMQNESVGYMIDALMDMPGTQFSKSLLAEKAGVSRQSVHTHITLLVNLRIVNEVDESDPVTYTLNDDDEIVRLLHQVEGVVNRRLNPKTDE